MATVKALIRKNKKNSKGLCTVYLRYGHQQKAVDISTGIKAKPEYWSEKKEMVNSVSSIKKNKINEELIKRLIQADLVVNTSVETKKAEIMEIARTFQLKSINPTTNQVKDEFCKANSNVEDVDLSEEKLSPLYENFIKHINRSNSTKEKYENALYHLQSFETHTKQELRIKDINLDFYDRLIKFLFHDIKKPDESKGLSDNTVGTTIKNLKVFFKHLIKRGYPIENNLTEFKVPKVNTPIYFLTEEELTQLTNHIFEEERLAKVRDVFVFNCYTGLRFSDLERLSKSHIKDGVIQMRAYKNQKDIFVPLTSVPKRILKKYDYKLPLISEQKYNEYIKEACEKAGIKSEVDLIKISSGNKIYQIVPKHKIITSHIAVKTFISLCGKKGVSPKAVSEVTGKSVEVIIKHYYGIDHKTIKEQMTKAFN